MGHPHPSLSLLRSSAHQTIRTQKTVHEFRHGGMLRCCDVSPDGKMAASGAGAIKLWDLTTGVQIGEQLTCPGGLAGVVRFLPGNRLLSSHTNDGKARVWDLATRQIVKEIDVGGMYIAVSPDLRLIACGRDDLSTIVIETTMWTERTLPAAGHREFSPDGRRLLIGGNSRTIWDLETKTEQVRFQDDGELRYPRFTADGRYVLSGGKKSLWLWDAAN